MLNKLPKKVIIKDEAGRDGLQNEKIVIPTADKIALINAILETDVPGIQATSMVNPKWIPQLADAADVLMGINKKPGVLYSVLVPNKRGLERLLETRAKGAKVDEAGIIVSASEAHSKSNLNRTIAEVLAEVPEIIDTAHSAGILARVSISVSFGCTMEGKVPLARVLDIAGKLKKMGLDEITLSDTTGMGNPAQVFETFTELRKIMGHTEISAHFHDTRGLGLANIVAAMEAGISAFDSCIGGLGGCPFSPGASGNVCTEDVVNMMHEMGIETGINLAKLIECAKMAETMVKRPLPGHVKQAGPPKCGN